MGAITVEKLLILLISLAIYMYAFFQLVRNILDKDYTISSFILASLISTTLVTLILISELSEAWSFVVLFCIIYLNFKIVFKSTVRSTIFLSNAYIFNIMLIRQFILTAAAFFYKKSIYMIMSDDQLLFKTIAISIIVVIIATILVIKYMSAQKLRILLRTNELNTFVIGWIIVNNLYLLYSSWFFQEHVHYTIYYSDKLITYAFICVSTYAILFFNFRISELLGYEEQTETLNKKIDTQKKYISSMTRNALFSFEANLSKNTVVIDSSDFLEFGTQATEQNYTNILHYITKGIIHSKDKKRVLHFLSAEYLTEKFSNNETMLSIEYQSNYISDNSWMRLIVNIIQDEQIGDLKLLAYAVDITEEKNAVLLLTEKASKDPLTGLYNKKAAESLISRSIQQNQGILMLIDLDNFKAINDFQGHTEGDRLLSLFATQLTKIVREQDIVGRVGGDEFLVFITSPLSDTVLHKKLTEINNQLFYQFTDSYASIHIVSASIGVVRTTTQIDFAQAFQQADAAMYDAKTKGKNNYTIYSGQTFGQYKPNR